MPSTYAHTRFGGKVLLLLPEEVRQALLPHRALYDVGLQGPDVLFHYKALSKNPVNELGRAMHRQSGLKCFVPAVSRAQDDAYKAYLCGVLCHFVLDSVCHGTVNAVSAKTGVHHFDVETELERGLMLQDGLDPVRFHPTAHFAPDAELSRVMADFYGIGQQEAMGAAKGMKRNIDLLVPRNAVWRSAVGGVLKAAHADNFFRLMIPKEPRSGLAQEIAQLTALCGQAEAIALRLIRRFFEGTLLEDEQLKLDFATGTKVEESI